MKNLWAPWRLEHILGQAEKFPGCLFEAATNHSHAMEHLLLRRDRLAVTLLNRFPYANGHLLCAVAGAGIADHFHIIPRWQGDHNFMPPWPRSAPFPNTWRAPSPGCSTIPRNFMELKHFSRVGRVSAA